MTVSRVPSSAEPTASSGRDVPQPASLARLSGQLALPPEIVDGLKRIAAAAKGLFGPPSFRSLARSHLALFDELQRQGASRKQIGLLIAEYGVTGADGQPITAAVLRATVSAARKAAGAPAPDGAVRADGSERSEMQYSKAQHSETQHTKAQRSATQQVATQSGEAQRQEARRNETVGDEVQQHQPSSDRFRRPPPGLDDHLLRRAARVQRFKEDY
jgi:hypothetical protein